MTEMDVHTTATMTHAMLRRDTQLKAVEQPWHSQSFRSTRKKYKDYVITTCSVYSYCIYYLICKLTNVKYALEQLVYNNKLGA